MVAVKRLQIDKWNRRESPETDPLTYGNLIYVYERDGNSKLWGTEQVMLENWSSIWKKVKLDYALHQTQT